MNHFFALPLPEEVREEIGKLALDWRDMNEVHAIWYTPVDYHITLKFLGDVDTSRQAELIEAALPIATQTEPFTVDLNATPGAFPSLRVPRVLWAGAKESEELTLLAGCLESAMEPLGFRRERRPFKAHITLARCREDRPNPPAPFPPGRGRENKNWPVLGERTFPIFTANSFVLMQTLPPEKDMTKGRIGEKLRYNTVHVFPFGKTSTD